MINFILRLPFARLYFTLLSLIIGTNGLTSYANDDKRELLDEIQILNLHRLAREREYLSISYKKINCIKEQAYYSNRMIRLNNSLAQLSEKCSKSNLITKDENVSCLKSYITTAYLIKELTKNDLKECKGTQKIINSIDMSELLERIKKDLKNQKENFKIFLLNKQISNRDKYLSEANVNNQIFNCKMRIYDDYRRMIGYETQITVSFYRGNLFRLRKNIESLKVIRKKIELSTEICNIPDRTYTNKARKKLNKIIAKYINIDFIQMSKKACSILKKKNYKNSQIDDLCNFPVDTSSYRKSIDFFLSTFVEEDTQ